MYFHCTVRLKTNQDKNKHKTSLQLNRRRYSIVRVLELITGFLLPNVHSMECQECVRNATAIHVYTAFAHTHTHMKRVYGPKSVCKCTICSSDSISSLVAIETQWLILRAMHLHTIAVHLPLSLAFTLRVDTFFQVTEKRLTQAERISYSSLSVAQPDTCIMYNDSEEEMMHFYPSHLGFR